MEEVKTLQGIHRSSRKRPLVISVEVRCAMTGTDRSPSAALCGRRLSERIEKPARNQRMEPGHHGWEGPCGDFYPIISNLSLHRGQGDERVLTRLAGISRKPLGPAAEIGQPPIELRVLPIERERPGTNAVEQIVMRLNPL